MRLWRRRPPKPNIERFNKRTYRSYAPTTLSIMLICLLFLFGGLWLGNRVAEQRQKQPSTVMVTTFYQHKAEPITVTASGTSISISTNKTVTDK